MAKRRSSEPVLPPQFQIPAPGMNKDDVEPKAQKLLAYLKRQWKQWDDARRSEIVPTWRKAWKNFNSIDEPDDGESSTRGKKTWRSQAFHPMTEQKVMAGVSQADDVLFRSGSFPYDLRVSPISDAGLVTASFDESQGVTPEIEAQQAARDEAMRKMRFMKLKVDDQLAECNAVDEARSATFSAFLYGTAAVESPIIVRKTRNKKEKLPNGQFKTVQVEEDAPSFKALDVWQCWPDPSCAGDVQKGRGFYHGSDYMLQDIVALRDQVFGEDGTSEFDYIKENFDKLIDSLSEKSEDDSVSEGAEYVEDRPWLTSAKRQQASGTHQWVKFAGKVPNRLLVGVIDGVKNDRKYTEIISEYCNDIIVKVSENPFPKEVRPFHLIPFTKIPGSCWGRGVPQKIFDHQENVNRLIRQYIDNKRLSGNLMTAIDRSKLKKGESLEIYPGRNWEFTQGYAANDVRQLIQAISLPDVTGGILEAIEKFLMWADAASGVPRILEGASSESGATAFAENQRIIAASKQLGLVLKNFDEFGWVPIVRSFYDWNMEFADEKEIKGDYEVIATGFASFENKNMKKLDLERMLLMSQQNPVLAARVKAAPLLEDWFQTSALDVDRYLRSEAEAQTAAEQQQRDAMQQQQAMLELQQAMRDREHAAELEIVKAKADFSGATRAQLEQMRAEAKFVIDRMKIEAQKLIKAAELELGAKKLEVDRGKNRGDGGSSGFDRSRAAGAAKVGASRGSKGSAKASSPKA